ncbi:MAG: hypothetical protein ABEK00_02975 [Candidatus Nanohaloarchaea archaeon]
MALEEEGRREARKRSRKGFYFSFDAFLALAVMSASLLVVAQSSEISNDPFRSQTITYQKANLAGQDAMKLASQETFYEFNASFRQELVDRTVMSSSDLDRTILDGISLLWAARNFTYAERAAKRYFDSRIPGGYDYRLQVTEGGSTTEIYRTGPTPPNPGSVSSISRLVSGHKIDRPSEGFQARARATKVRKNQTRSFSVSSQGGARFGGRVYITKEFNISADRIWNASLYLTPHYGCSNNNFEVIEINGNKFTNPEITWFNRSENCRPEASYDYGTGALGYIDVTDKVSPGQNRMFIRFRNNGYNAHVHPGMRMRVKYSSSEISQVEGEKREVRFDNLRVDEHADDKTGLFSVKGYEIPEGVELKNVTFHLEATGIDRQYNGSDIGWCEVVQPGGERYIENAYDIRVLHDGKVIDRGYAPVDGSISRTYDLTGETHTGTNLVSVYFNFKKDCAWGEDTIELASNAGGSDSTRIEIWYENRAGSLEFGEIELSRSRFFGEEGNPVELEKEFNYSELESTRIYATQLTGSSINVSTRPSGDSWETVFSSPALRAVPSSLYVDASNYDTDVTNYIRMTDQNPDNVFLRQSGFQYTMSVPSQVGYSGLFENRSAAIKDARERLEDTLGQFVDATGLSTDSLSTGNQPYLWGPASIKLVVWRE